MELQLQHLSKCYGAKQHKGKYIQRAHKDGSGQIAQTQKHGVFQCGYSIVLKAALQREHIAKNQHNHGKQHANRHKKVDPERIIREKLHGAKYRKEK